MLKSRQIFKTGLSAIREIKSPAVNLIPAVLSVTIAVLFLQLILILFPSNTSAQNALPDGLHHYKEAKKILSDGDSVRAIEKLASIADRSDFRSVNNYMDSVNLLGKLYFESGRITDGLTLFQKSEPYSRKLSRIKTYINFLTLYGMFLSSSGYCDKGASFHGKAVAEATLLNENRILSNTLINQAASLAECGDHSGSLELLKTSYQTSRTGTNSNRVHILIKIADATVNTGDIEKAAIRLITAGNHVNPKSPEALNQCFTIINMADSINNSVKPPLKTRLNQLIVSMLTITGSIAEQTGNLRARAETAGLYGKLFLSEKQYDSAVRKTRKALFLANQQNLPRSQYIWQWQLGKIFRESGRTDDAIDSYKKAISVLDPVRGDLLVLMQTDSSYFQNKIRPVYTGYAHLLIMKAGLTTTSTVREQLIIDARAAMDQLKTYELQDYFNDECITCIKNKNPADDKGLSALSSVSPENKALVYPIIFKDSLDIILTLPSGTRHIRVPVTGKTLSETVKRFRKRLQSPPGKRYRYYSVQLYDYLIRPIEKYLASDAVDTLIIVPDGVLRLVPFSAFYDGDRYLAETWATVVVPTAESAFISSSSPDLSNMLICGLSETNTFKSFLPGVTRELTRLRDLTGGTLMMNRKFTANELSAELKRNDYSVIHLATHGFFDSIGGGTLETYDGEISIETLEHLMRIGRFRQTGTDLLTLSACDSGVGDERAALGLGGVALKAGVKSAIATLWFINDRAASETVLRFYTHLTTPGTTKARALQKAHIDMIQSDTFSHPAFWSPFLLIGSWQ